MIQLVNKLTAQGQELLKNGEIAQTEVIPFEVDDEELMKVFASRPQVAIENAQLTENIENLFKLRARVGKGDRSTGPDDLRS